MKARPNLPLRIRNLAGRLAVLEGRLEGHMERLAVFERMIELQRIQQTAAFSQLAEIAAQLAKLAARGTRLPQKRRDAGDRQQDQA